MTIAKSTVVSYLGWHRHVFCVKTACVCGGVHACTIWEICTCVLVGQLQVISVTSIALVYYKNTGCHRSTFPWWRGFFGVLMTHSYWVAAGYGTEAFQWGLVVVTLSYTQRQSTVSTSQVSWVQFPVLHFPLFCLIKFKNFFKQSLLPPSWLTATVTWTSFGVSWPCLPQSRGGETFCHGGPTIPQQRTPGEKTGMQVAAS